MEKTVMTCDGCGDEAATRRFATGGGEGVDLCDHCTRKAVLRCLKSGLWVCRALCPRCHGRGVVPHQGTWAECPTCCR